MPPEEFEDSFRGHNYALIIEYIRNNWKFLLHFMHNYTCNIHFLFL